MCTSLTWPWAPSNRIPTTGPVALLKFLVSMTRCLTFMVAGAPPALPDADWMIGPVKPPVASAVSVCPLPSIDQPSSMCWVEVTVQSPVRP